MRVLLLLILIAGLSGCVTATKGKVILLEDGVEFELGKAGKVYYKDGEKEAYYDTQTPSLIRSLIEASTLREINKD